MVKYGRVERIAAELTVLGAAIPPINTRSAVATKAFAASGSVNSLLGHGTRRTIVRYSSHVVIPAPLERGSGNPPPVPRYSRRASPNVRRRLPRSSFAE